MKQPDPITERDNLRREVERLRSDIDELTFCEECGNDCAKMPDNNCYPPRYCHTCQQILVGMVCESRSRISALEESLRVAQGERAQVAIKLANAVVVGYRAAKAGDVKAEEAAIELCDRLVEEYENLNLQSRLSCSLDNLDAKAAVKVGVWREGGDVEC